MPELLVSASNVSRGFMQGQTTMAALSAVNCEVVAGARIALVGPSGSGKTTLLHLLGALDTPTAGAIQWPGLGSRESLRPGKIGLVFQLPSLLAPLTIVENVELPLLLLGRAAADARDSAVGMLSRFDLQALAERLPEELSGGQAQRVAVARALVCRPLLLLADEPTGQLDHDTADRLLDELMEALAGTGTALVIATHDHAVARRMDIVWRMEHGALEVAK